jgi:hypothetical protein
MWACGPQAIANTAGITRQIRSYFDISGSYEKP